MDRMSKIAFLATIAGLVGIEFASIFLHRLPWARAFAPLSWTAMVRFADILLFLSLFGLLSIPISAAGLRRVVRGSMIGLIASLVLGSGFFLVQHLVRSNWGVDLRAILGTGHKVRGLAPLALLCLLGPFVEEIFFRGLCYTLIRAYRGIWVSVALSAGVFAVSHLLTAVGLHVILVPLVGGVIFALLFEFSRSLFAPFVLHVVANFILFSGIL